MKLGKRASRQFADLLLNPPKPNDKLRAAAKRYLKTTGKDEMRIYRIKVEHQENGTNWSKFDLAGEDFDAVVKKAKKRLAAKEKIESVELLASED